MYSIEYILILAELKEINLILAELKEINLILAELKEINLILAELKEINLIWNNFSCDVYLKQKVTTLSKRYCLKLILNAV